MKKFCAVLSVFVLISSAAAAQDVGFYEEPPDVYYPIQLALYPTIQIAPYDQDFAGLRLNIIGVNRRASGLDIGLSNQTDDQFRGGQLGVVNLAQGNSYGVTVGFVNNVKGDMKGFQGIPLLTWWNAVNFVQGQAAGAQGGLFNSANTLSGVQGGLINVAGDAKGVMLGLYNHTQNFTGVQVGLANISYDSMTGAQVGIYNGVRYAKGFQLGLINQCQMLDGLQVGLVNIASQKESMPTMLFVNWKF